MHTHILHPLNTAIWKSLITPCDLTLAAVDWVDGLLPACVLLRSSGKTVLLVQVQLEPNGQRVQLSLLCDGQQHVLDLPGAQTLQLLHTTNAKLDKTTSL